MRKKLVEIDDSNIDCIIGIGLMPVFEADKHTPVYHNEEKTLQRYNQTIGSIYFTVPVYNEHGICGYNKFALKEKDIISIYNTFQGIKDTITVEPVFDDLPY
jgi:hypothetical protein